MELLICTVMLTVDTQQEPSTSLMKATQTGQKTVICAEHREMMGAHKDVMY